MDKNNVGTNGIYRLLSMIDKCRFIDDFIKISNDHSCRAIGSTSNTEYILSKRSKGLIRHSININFNWIRVYNVYNINMQSLNKYIVNNFDRL